METTEIFERLKTLQNILVQKYDLEAKIEEAPKQLSSQDELLARMKKEYIEKNKSYEEVKERVTHLKDELDETIKTREDGEKNMDNITTHREYEALDKLISEASEREALLVLRSASWELIIISIPFILSFNSERSFSSF